MKDKKAKQGGIPLRYYKKKSQIIFLIIAALLLGRMCFYDQTVKAISFCTSNAEITSSAQLTASQTKQVLGQKFLCQRTETTEALRRAGRRGTGAFLRKNVISLSFEGILPQHIHSTVFFQNSKVIHNTSGHILLIQCMNRGDGKKRIS